MVVGALFFGVLFGAAGLGLTLWLGGGWLTALLVYVGVGLAVTLGVLCINTLWSLVASRLERQADDTHDRPETLATRAQTNPKSASG